MAVQRYEFYLRVVKTNILRMSAANECMKIDEKYLVCVEK